MYRQIDDIQYKLKPPDIYAIKKAKTESMLYRNSDEHRIIELAYKNNSYVELRKKSLLASSFLYKVNSKIKPEEEFYSLAYPPTEEEVKSLRFVQDKYGINSEYAAERAIERVVACLPQRGLTAHIATLSENDVENRTRLYRELDERNLWHSDNVEDIQYLAYEKEIGLAEASNELYAIDTVDEASEYADDRLRDFFEDNSGSYWLWLSNPGACDECENNHMRVFSDDEIASSHPNCKCSLYSSDFDKNELLHIIGENERQRQELNLRDNVNLSDDSLLDGFQTLLDVVGLIPGVGEIADGVNALISLARGDYLGAALSATSMIPFAGWASAGVKFVRGADKFIDAAKIADDIYAATKLASQADAVADATRILDKADGALKIKKPYMKPGSRPRYAKGQAEAVWEAAKRADGRVIDELTGAELFWDKTKPRNGQWDMGHIKGKEYVTLHEKYRIGNISYEEFMKEYKNIDNYKPQGVYSNRSNNQRKR